MSDPTTEWVAGNSNYDLEKHLAERAEQGFSTYDWWNFCDYIAWVNINALEKFKTGAGYPGQLSGPEEWAELLDQMIDGFKAALEINDLGFFEVSDTKENNAARYKAVVARKDKGLALYAEHLNSLWD
jgi:hypothetical protein